LIHLQLICFFFYRGTPIKTILAINNQSSPRHLVGLRSFLVETEKWQWWLKGFKKEHIQKKDAQYIGNWRKFCILMLCSRCILNPMLEISYICPIHIVLMTHYCCLLKIKNALAPVLLFSLLVAESYEVWCYKPTS